MFERITAKEDFARVYPIMAASFPETELRDEAGQRALLEREGYRLYGIKEADDGYFAVIAAWELAEDFVYLEHFAVAEGKRNGGIGGRLLEEFLAWYGKKAVLEVEVPEDVLTKRRVGFYERHGFYYNEYPYLQPPMRPGQGMLPLRLMTRPAPIQEEEYQRYRRLIYRQVYRYFGE
ncbi:GNAT family N-acetyltransferase [Anaerotignum lactatifermentans]|uniref:GNAT family N-acetyltransferase n=1 Tax=Anaerotignum lactatifermentans TaxID=160404 RepID=A0ABS2G9Q6_9FIRM|nr:GNAT family N-acetyltransferase [Anaerotignum lactatifermentans]MBM6829841.1 GNAT family N-acetyltransferase [Anaerotignum lactatifermentans]MBM6878219.1 GNAT family N-acetyltransferase [Anaerotignum lactatifermentans]MBM6951299.1 GNAT family N-acetyltransferase [Anaerotignum lactatifermentans]